MSFVDEFRFVSCLNSVGELVKEVYGLIFGADFLGEFRGRVHG